MGRAQGLVVDAVYTELFPQLRIATTVPVRPRKVLMMGCSASGFCENRYSYIHLDVVYAAYLQN